MGPDHPITLKEMGAVASLAAEQGRFAEAERLYADVLEQERRVFGPEHPITLGDTFGLCETYRLEGKYPEAQALLNRTLEAQRRVLGPEHPFVLESEVSLALTLQSMGKSAESEPVIRHVMEVNRSKQPGSWQFFLAESLLGASLAQQRKYAEAEPLLLEGYRGMEARKQRIDASNAHYLERVREAIFQLYQASGRPGEAAHWQ
jgi:tetratricopeptide (TPR) repeat protein